MTADGFKDRHDVAPLFAGQYRAAVNKHAGPIHTRHGDATGGHVFVATANGNKTIKTLSTDDGFNGISDDFPRDQGIAHARRAHGNAVGYGNGVEQHRFGASFVRAHGSCFGQLVDVHVAGSHHAPGRRNTNLWFAEVFRLKASGVEHCPTWGLLNTVDDNGAVGAFVSHHFSFGVVRA